MTLSLTTPVFPFPASIWTLVAVALLVLVVLVAISATPPPAGDHRRATGRGRFRGLHPPRTA